MSETSPANDETIEPINMAWWSVWFTVLSQPYNHVYEAILGRSTHKSRKAILWLAASGAVFGIVRSTMEIFTDEYSILQSLFMIAASTLQFSVFAIFGQLLNVFLINLFAGKNANSTTPNNLLLLNAAIASPLLIIRSLPEALNIDSINAILQIYQYALTLVSIKSVYGVSSSRAFAISLGPIAIVIAFYLVQR